MTESPNIPPALPEAPAPTKGRSLWSDAWKRIVSDKSAVVCMIIIAIYAMIAIGAGTYEIIAEKYDSVTTFSEYKDYDNRNHAPTFEDWKWILGTDKFGRSILLKTLMGAKVSMMVGLMTNIIAIPLGMILGAIAGYYGRRIDDIIVWLYTTLSSIPGIILLIALKYTFKEISPLGLDLSGIHGIYIALGLMSWIGTCRLVRAETMKIRELDYVIAAKAIGTPGPIVLLRHIIPNVLHLGIISFSLGFVGAISAEVILSYLGLGVGVGTPSWGTMIDSARLQLIEGIWWEMGAAVIAMFFLILALNIFGDRLRDALDPKLRNV